MYGSLRPARSTSAFRPSRPPGGFRKVRSVAGTADTSNGFLTPLEVGRREMYDTLPFTAVHGLQGRSRRQSRSYADFAQGMLGPDAKVIVGDGDLGGLDDDANILTPNLIASVIVASAASFLVGFNTAALNPVAKQCFPGKSVLEWSMAVSAFAVGGPLGATAAGPKAKRSGVKSALQMTFFVYLLAGFGQVLSTSVWCLAASRFFVGAASGSSTVLVPLYLGEISPPSLRGSLGTVTQFAMVIGILFASALYGLIKDWSWRWLLGATPAVALAALLAAPEGLLESPRHLLLRNPESTKARAVIRKLRGLRYEEEVEVEVSHILTASSTQSTDADLRSLLKSTSSRLLLSSCVALQIAQQFCGINAVFYYSTTFFDGVIDDPVMGSTIVAAINVVATYVALVLMDKCGRRTLLLYSSGGMLICTAFMTAALGGALPKTVALAATAVYVFFFEIGLGPIPWLIVAEMFPAKHVAIAMSLCCQINWACNFVVGATFPTVNGALGFMAFVPFGTVLLITVIGTWLYLPETHNTTPESLEQDLHQSRSSIPPEVFTSLQLHAEESMGIGYDDDGFVDQEQQDWTKAMLQLQDEEQKQLKDGSYRYAPVTLIKEADKGDTGWLDT